MKITAIINANDSYPFTSFPCPNLATKVKPNVPIVNPPILAKIRGITATFSRSALSCVKDGIIDQ